MALSLTNYNALPASVPFTRVSSVLLNAGSRYNVKHHGATGDGSTNDLVAVQAAVTAAQLAPSDKVQVYFDDGVYNLGGGTLNVAGATLTGHGQIYNGTISLGSNSSVINANTAQVLIAPAGDDILIQGTEIGNWQKDWFAGISIRSNCNRLSIIGNHIHDIRMATPASYMTTYGAGIKLEISGMNMSDLVIMNNHMHHISGPSAIWLGLYGTLKNTTIMNNYIHDTGLFGIEAYSSGGTFYVYEMMISHNVLRNIGLYREVTGAGNGAGGIYMSISGKSTVTVSHNDIRHVVEVGIEGDIHRIIDNYVEDTGCDQYNFPIADCACIYSTGKGAVIKGNTLVNPGGNENGGGFHLYAPFAITSLSFIDNHVDGGVVDWETSTSYLVGEYIKKGANWYVCTTAGTSGGTGPSGTGAGITDGSAVWRYKKTVCLYGFKLNHASYAFNGLTISHNTFIDIPTPLYVARFSGGCKVTRNDYNNPKVSHTAWLENWGGSSGTNILRTPYVDD